MFVSISLGSTDHCSIWAPAQPFPCSAWRTCLLSFVSRSIFSSDARTYGWSWVLQFPSYLSDKLGLEVSPLYWCFESVSDCSFRQAWSIFLYFIVVSLLRSLRCWANSGPASSHLCTLHGRKRESWFWWSISRANVIIVWKATLYASGSAEKSV